MGRAADGERLWSLRDPSGWVASADRAGAPGFPVWPQPDYASACATGVWAGYLPAEIDVHAFMEACLPDMAKRGVSVEVFPTPSARGVWMGPEELQRHLADELDKYA
ncbi:MAG: DUF2750 domain-containing protein [Massilia sp.]|nr:MAG: DUF2750 domain-containing protein [Massilia sp.]